MPKILPTIIAAALLSACAAGQAQKTTQALHVATCIMADERLGKAVDDPQAAADYLESVKAEISVIRADINDIIDAWQNGPPAGLADELAVLDQAMALLLDLEDLARRLQACIGTGTKRP